MKVLHVVPSLNLGGAERLALDVCDGLKRRGIEVELVYFQGDNLYKEAYPDFHPEKIEDDFSLKLFRGVNSEPTSLEKFVANLNPDIIHSHLFASELRTRSLSISDKVWVTHLHDNMRQFRTGSVPTNLASLANWYERYYLIQQYRKKGNNHFLSISSDTTKYFETHLPADLRSNIHSLSNAIDVSRFERASTPKMDVLRMCNVGSFQPKKNQRLLLDVAKQLKNRVEFELHFVGSGELEDNVRNEAVSLGLSDCTFFHGNVSDVERILNEMNLYVHSAYYEPFGLVLLEAMASGLPVVCLDGKGNRDVVQNGVNGTIVSTSSPIEYANAIMDLWNDKDFYQSYVSAGLITAETHSMTAYLDSLMGLYREWTRNKS